MTQTGASAAGERLEGVGFTHSSARGIDVRADAR